MPNAFIQVVLFVVLFMVRLCLRTGRRAAI